MFHEMDRTRRLVYVMCEFSSIFATGGHSPCSTRTRFSKTQVPCQTSTADRSDTKAKPARFWPWGTFAFRLAFRGIGKSAVGQLLVGEPDKRQGYPVTADMRGGLAQPTRGEGCVMGSLMRWHEKKLQQTSVTTARAARTGAASEAQCCKSAGVRNLRQDGAIPWRLTVGSARPSHWSEVHGSGWGGCILFP